MRQDATIHVQPTSVMRAAKKKTQAIDTEFLTLGDRRIHEPQRVSASRYGMVSTAHHGATAAGAAMLDAGGNAFDAAVAAAFALGVCEPAASGLGGQTMLLLHDAGQGRTVALDGSSRAPNRAMAEAFEDGRAERRRGYCATTVPSTPAVLDYVRATYGTLPLRTLLEPAIQLADDGYEISLLQYALTRRELRFLKRAPRPLSFYATANDRIGPVSDFGNRSLRRHCVGSPRAEWADFYQGEIARAIETDMIANGGLLRLDDLAQIPQPIERRPLTGRFFGQRVFTMPPPGAGQNPDRDDEHLRASARAISRPREAGLAPPSLPRRSAVRFWTGATGRSIRTFTRRFPRSGCYGTTTRKSSPPRSRDRSRRAEKPHICR